MQFLVVLVLLAVLLHAGDASEHELAEEQTRNAQQMIDESNEAIINAIADQYPELREEMHERRLLAGLTIVKYLGYYQFSTFLVNNKPSCSGTGAPLLASGVGYGCRNIMATCRQNMPCSMAQSCEEASGGIKIGAKMYSGPNCTGNEINAAAMSSYAQIFGACKNGVKYSCASANGPPASRYDGYRVTTYWNTDMCMGQPMTYSDFYNSASKSYFCKDGKISYKSGTSTTAITTASVTCKSTTSAIQTVPISVAYGCISAMKSTSERTYIKFNLSQIIKGLSSSVWNKASNKSKNYIALGTALARVLSLDYDAIENLKVTPKVTSSAPSSGLQTVTPEVEVTYTIKVQPGFGNDYTEGNVYSSLKSKMVDATKATCTSSNCFLPALKSVAPSSISSGVTSTSYNPSATTPPSVVKQTPTSSTPPASTSTTTSKKSSGAAVAGAVIGGLVFVGAIGGFFYYTRVYKPKQLAQGAAAANMPPAPQVQGASNPVHGSPGAANFASPPPQYPSYPSQI